jgi:hypothetical protein
VAVFGSLKYNLEAQMLELPPPLSRDVVAENDLTV